MSTSTTDESTSIEEEIVNPFRTNKDDTDLSDSYSYTMDDTPNTTSISQFEMTWDMEEDDTMDENGDQNEYNTIRFTHPDLSKREMYDMTHRYDVAEMNTYFEIQNDAFREVYPAEVQPIIYKEIGDDKYIPIPKMDNETYIGLNEDTEYGSLYVDMWKRINRINKFLTNREMHFDDIMVANNNLNVQYNGLSREERVNLERQVVLQQNVKLGNFDDRPVPGDIHVTDVDSFSMARLISIYNLYRQRKRPPVESNEWILFQRLTINDILPSARNVIKSILMVPQTYNEWARNQQPTLTHRTNLRNIIETFINTMSEAENIGDLRKRIVMVIRLLMTYTAVMSPWARWNSDHLWNTVTSQLNHVVFFNYRIAVENIMNTIDRQYLQYRTDLEHTN